MSSVGTIEYAPPPPWHRGRRIRRVVAIAIVSVVVGLVVYNRQFIWHRARLLHHQRQCATYTAPSDHVVFDSDPERAALLATQPDYLLGPSSVPLRSYVKTAGHTTAVHVPPCFRELQFIFADNRGSRSNALLFLHERTSRGGHQRIVAIRCSSMVDEHWIPDMIEWVVITPAGLTSQPVRRVGYDDTRAQRTRSTRRIEHAPIRMFAGQPDPVDPARFTIAYETRGQAFLLHGILTDDGEAVRLSHMRP